MSLERCERDLVENGADVDLAYRLYTLAFKKKSRHVHSSQ